LSHHPLCKSGLFEKGLALEPLEPTSSACLLLQQEHYSTSASRRCF